MTTPTRDPRTAPLPTTRSDAPSDPRAGGRQDDALQRRRAQAGGGAGDRVLARLLPLWRDRRVGLATALAVAATWAVLAGSWTPRGPLTTAEALITMAVSLLVGAGVGLAMRSRWALLVAPVVFATAFELVRMGADGPTVDQPHVTSSSVKRRRVDC